METLLLSNKDIEKLITIDEIIEIVKKTYIGFGEGKVINPTKLKIEFGTPEKWPFFNSSINALPAYVGWINGAGLKVSGTFLNNAKHNLPTMSIMIILVNPQNGHFEAILEGVTPSSLRTGANAAVCLWHLNQEKRVKIGLYGGGFHGLKVILAISKIFDIEVLKIYDIKRETSEKFVKDVGGWVNGKIFIADSPEEVANDSNVVISITTSKDRFIKDSWIKPGTILMAMGSNEEISEEFILKADKIVVDHIGQCLERGSLKEMVEKGKISEKNIYATIGELAVKKKKVTITNNERIFCMPIGTGALDVAVATIIYNKAIEKGVGNRFTFINPLD